MVYPAAPEPSDGGVGGGAESGDDDDDDDGSKTTKKRRFFGGFDEQKDDSGDDFDDASKEEETKLTTRRKRTTTTTKRDHRALKNAVNARGITTTAAAAARPDGRFRETSVDKAKSQALRFLAAKPRTKKSWKSNWSKTKGTMLETARGAGRNRTVRITLG